MGTRFVLLALNLGLTSLALCQNVRLTNDVSGGYTSAYTLATGIPYTDSVLAECSIARGRQNEPAVAVDPRNAKVLIGSSNDYCGVYAGSVRAASRHSATAANTATRIMAEVGRNITLGLSQPTCDGFIRALQGPPFDSACPSSTLTRTTWMMRRPVGALLVESGLWSGPLFPLVHAVWTPAHGDDKTTAVRAALEATELRFYNAKRSVAHNLPGRKTGTELILQTLAKWQALCM
jgi:hypothetical protein